MTGSAPNIVFGQDLGGRTSVMSRCRCAIQGSVPWPPPIISSNKWSWARSSSSDQYACGPGITVTAIRRRCRSHRGRRGPTYAISDSDQPDRRKKLNDLLDHWSSFRRRASSNGTRCGNCGREDHSACLGHGWAQFPGFGGILDVTRGSSAADRRRPRRLVR